MSPLGRITLACDEPLPGLADRLAATFPGRAVNDLTGPALLSSLLVKN